MKYSEFQEQKDRESRAINLLRRYRAKAVGVCLLQVVSLASPAVAQTSTWKEGYKQVIPAATVDSLSADGMFGEQVSLYTGEVTFATTDVSLKGSNALEVSFRRKLEMNDSQSTRSWVMDLPHLEGTYPEDVGWTRKNLLSGATGRCSSKAAAPPNATGTSTASGTPVSTWDPGEFWSGDYLSLPGSGTEELLKVQTGGARLPTDGASYFWVTRSGWRFSCLSVAKNDAGEGFLGISPDGTKYYFDWFSSAAETALVRPATSGPAPFAPTSRGRKPGTSPTFAVNLSHGLLRKRVLIYPSKIVDRFGNYVDYTYTGTTTTIAAGDGRALTVNHGNPMTVVANGRTWTYSSNANGIYTVTLPDNSKWIYDLNAVLNQQFAYGDGIHGSVPSESRACDDPLDPVGTGGSGISGTVTHPSGAVGTFTFVPVRHGRSYVDRNCIGYSEGGAFYGYPYRPYVFHTRSLKSKTINGPGLTSATWQYQYGPANNSWASNCTSGCVATKYVDVTEPNGERTRHIYSNRWQSAEGRELATERYDAGNVLRERVDMTYFLTNSGQAYPAQIGLSGNSRGDGTSMRFDPLSESKTTRDGRSFSWKVANDCIVNSQTTYCFDDLARPTKTIKSSAPAP